MNNKDLFKRLDVPLIFRVPHKTHKEYKALSGFEKKAIQYKLNVWIVKQLKNINNGDL